MSYTLDTISVLIIEDNKPMQDLTKNILNTFGFKEIYTAANGREGFMEFCRFSPDIVIADWMMKPVNGIELTELIRTHPDSPNPYVPVILMTGFSEKHRVLEARDRGVTEFLVKPFNARELYRRIAQVIEKPRQFVKADRFFGPDRRRTKNKSYEGPLRRETDIRPEDYEQTKAPRPSQSDE